MDNVTFEKVSEILKDFSVNKFVTDVDRYVKVRAVPGTDEKCDEKRNGKVSFFKKLSFFRKPQVPADKETDEDLCDVIDKESETICSRSALLLKYLGEFRFVQNGHPESDEKILLYFKKMKQQQQTLVSEISDETEMIRNIVVQSEQMRNLIKSHSEQLQQTALMLGIIQERLARRSTAVPVPLLPSAENEIKNNRPLCPDDLFQDAFNGIEQRKQKLISGAQELKDGWNLIENLWTGIKVGSKLSTLPVATRKKFDTLMNRHDLRVFEFQKQVSECRERWGFTAAGF